MDGGIDDLLPSRFVQVHLREFVEVLKDLNSKQPSTPRSREFDLGGSTPPWMALLCGKRILILNTTSAQVVLSPRGKTVN